MSRYRFTPPGYHDGATYPVVLMLPPAEFKDADDLGVVSERQATASLAKAGFLVFQIEHRLAYPGILTPHDNTPGSQPPHTLPVDTSGLPPQQQGDIERQVLAALADPHCNQSIYLVGGSSGGCHALWVALTSAASDNSGWTASARTHIKAAVSLSGPTDLGNWTDYDVGQVNIGHFIGDGENYTNTKVYPPDDADKKTIMTADSPISLVPGATSVPPILMFGTELDPVPWQQGNNMSNALLAHGVMTAFFHKVNGSADHAFNYWYETDLADIPAQRSVGIEVRDFLNAHP